MHKLKNISHQVIILGMVSFFTDFASEMLYPVTPIFLTSVLGASMSLVGLIEGIAEVTAGFLKGYFGALSDKVGRRSIFIVIGYGISGLVKSLPGSFPSVPVVIFSRVGDRIGKGVRTAPRDALLSNYAKDNTGAVFGFHRSMDTLGAVIGPLVSLLLIGVFSFSYSAIYLIAIIPSIGAIFFTWLVKDVKSQSKSSSRKMYSQFWKTAPHQYKSLLILITIFSFANSSDVFLILKSRQVTHSDFISILGYVFYNSIYAIASYPLGIISDKIGKKKMVVTGMFIFSIVYLGFGLNTNIYIVWFLFALYGIYAAATEGISKAWLADIVPNEFLGSAIGLLTMLSSFAVMFGSFFAGILWDKFGAQIPFLISASISLIIALLLIRIRK